MTKNDIVEYYKAISNSLVSFVMSTVASNDTVKPAKFHYWLSDALLNSQENIAMEGFRESAKTSYVVYGYPLYALTFPRYDRSYIVLLKASDTLAKQKLKDIKDIFFSNKLLSANVQKVYQQGDVLDILMKENGLRVRIEAYGKGMNIRGLSWRNKRPDIVILDDVQTKDDVISDLISDRDWEWFLSDVYMLSKKSRTFMIGNNLGERCIIERLSKNAKRFGFKFVRIPAIKNGKAVWKEKFTYEQLMKEKEAYADVGKLSIWLQERMCQAVSPETQVIKQKYFRYYSKLPTGRMSYFTAVDLAISESKRADYTVVTTIAVNEDNIRFIERMDYGRWSDIDKIISLVFEHIRQYRPQEVAIETVAFQAVLEKMLRKRMLTENVFFNITSLKPRGKKEIRLMSLQPLYATGAIFHKQDSNYLTELEHELLLFTEDGTKADHDDLMDALEMVNSIAKPPVGGKRGINGNNKLQRKAVM